ncbi:MAG: PAS domain S-box protein, partial [Terriglobia bacterium]|nr:PAS domain S-box protein [Terriglobia bacterium]
AGASAADSARGEDLAAQTKSEVAAKVCEARLQLISDTSPNAIIIMDEKGAIEMFSPAASRLFGYTAEEAAGCDVKMLMPSTYHSENDVHLSRYQSTGKKHTIGKWRIAVGQRKDGRTFPMEISVGESLGGERPLFTCFMRDVSERQHRLQELQGELLHVSRLSVMGQMTAAIAHELNQPLTAIANYVIGASRTLASMENKQDASACAQEMMEKAANQTLRAGAIVKSLGDFVKKRASNRTPENLNKVVEEAIALGFVGAADSNVKLRLDLDSTLPLAVIDRIQIQQVLINLIRNSIEAMASMEPAERKQLSVTTTHEQPNFVVITVCDTGPGLPAEVSKNLFRPLLTTKDRGMGMGLAICRSIVDAHGGNIWTSPEISRGTTFNIRLPLSGAAGSSP